MPEMSRRELLRYLLALGISAATVGTLSKLIACSNGASPPPTSPPTATRTATPSSVHIAVARGVSPTAMVEAALKALGGIEHFVKPGNDVIIKPNMCVGNHSYEYAVTTNPEVVAALVKLCLGAGAKRVRVMDNPGIGTIEKIWAISGIGEAVKAAGGQMDLMKAYKFEKTAIPLGRDITQWPVYSDVLDTDVLINVPIAKDHNLSRLTLGMKNLMGVIESRQAFHFNLGQRLADLCSLVRPSLTIVDAVRILVRHGPQGGSLDDVQLTNTIIASPDIVAADSYAATLFGLTGYDIPAIHIGAQMGLGIMDFSRVKVEEISV